MEGRLMQLVRDAVLLHVRAVNVAIRYNYYATDEALAIASTSDWHKRVMASYVVFA